MPLAIWQAGGTDTKAFPRPMQGQRRQPNRGGRPARPPIVGGPCSFLVSDTHPGSAEWSRGAFQEPRAGVPERSAPGLIPAVSSPAAFVAPHKRREERTFVLRRCRSGQPALRSLAAATINRMGFIQALAPEETNPPPPPPAPPAAAAASQRALKEGGSAALFSE